jgi:signal transduction histidine kinase
VSNIEEQLSALAAHLAARRKAILKAWRKAVDADPELTTASSLPRSQFVDHIPNVLDAYALKLHLNTKKEDAAADKDVKKSANEHGLNRWQQGYKLREVTREWGHLHLCLIDELESYTTANPGLELGVMTTAWRALAQLHSDGVTESTTQYFQLQETEATGQVRDLELAMEELQGLERQRGELLRQAAHDLRGNLSAVANASAGLGYKNIPEASREKFVRLLQNSVSSLHSMLEDVMNLARLQAAQEHRTVEATDAAALIKDLSDNMQPMASDRGLYLKSDGQEALPVEGDPIKIRRIAQNLLINALKYTKKGGVTISWGDSRDNDPKRWMLCVQDTGPGYHAGPGAPLIEALKEATDDAEQSRAGSQGPATAPEAPPDPRPVHQESGEGIGLSIVKRLCELLDACLEVESKVGVGTTFRVIFPRQYS